MIIVYPSFFTKVFFADLKGCFIASLWSNFVHLFFMNNFLKFQKNTLWSIPALEIKRVRKWYYNRYNEMVYNKFGTFNLLRFNVHSLIRISYTYFYMMYVQTQNTIPIYKLLDCKSVDYNQEERPRCFFCNPKGLTKVYWSKRLIWKRSPRNFKHYYPFFYVYKYKLFFNL